MKSLIFAGNWKMHLGPAEARRYLDTFLATAAARHRPGAARQVWFFPPAVSIEAVTGKLGGLPGYRVGVQNLHWEDRGAFTGEVSGSMAREAGATLALIGHSERRHVFGETDAQVARKLGAALRAGLTAVLCVGETLEQRDRGVTLVVVERQLSAFTELPPDGRGDVVVAYEPVWAIGTGRTATPADAAEVHASIRRQLAGRGGRAIPILYGGSVNAGNVQSLIAEAEIDGVLVGGASVDPDSWSRIIDADPD